MSTDQDIAVSMSSQDVSSNVRLIEEGRAFFCSEIVVKALKLCGILRQTEEASSNFLPVHLSSAKDKLNLVDGAKYENEQLILTSSMLGEMTPD